MPQGQDKIKITQKEFDELYQLEDEIETKSEPVATIAKIKTFDEKVKEGDAKLEAELDEGEFDEVVEYDM